MTNIRLFVVATMSILVACGDDAEPVAQSERFPPLEAAQPLELNEVDIGVGLRSGEVRALARNAPAEYQRVVQTLEHAVMHVQSYDEAVQQYGEYVIYPGTSMEAWRMPAEFLGTNVGNGRFHPRVVDLDAEIIEARDLAGADDFSSRTLVMDLKRIRGDWWVRWDGLLSEEANLYGKGRYGLYRQDMINDLVLSAELAAQEMQPRYFIIGRGVERLLEGSGGGLSREEFFNLHALVQRMVPRIRAASPNTKIGVGFQWDRFLQDVAPLYATEGAETLQVWDAAFEAAILPFLLDTDVLALESYADFDDQSAPERYQFLRRIAGLYDIDTPVVFYAIGAPVGSSVDYLRQRNYLNAFLEWNAGVPIEFLAWRALMNVDGSDTADQMFIARCRGLTTDERFLMPTSHCLDGLYTSGFRAKEIVEVFEE